MNTKNIAAILMATIIAMALFAPTAMVQGGIQIPIEVPNEPPEVVCKCEFPNPVIPNPDPEAPLEQQATVTICAVVCDPNGKDDIPVDGVTATVYKPDGTPLYEDVKMGDGGTCDCQLLKPEIAQDPVLCDRLDDPTCQLYVSEPLVITIYELGGEYRVVVTATDKTGGEDKLQNRFFVESLVLFDIDFTGLIFEDIEICEPSYIFGDGVKEQLGQAPPVKPTIHNAGNDPIQISIHFNGFVPDSGGDPVETIKMDARIPELLIQNPASKCGFQDVMKSCSPMYSKNTVIPCQ